MRTATEPSVRRSVVAPHLRRLVLTVLTLLVLVLGAPAASAASVDVGEHPVELVVYAGEGCPHCADLAEWLDAVVEVVPSLTVTEREVWYDEANRELLHQDAERLGFEASGVPVVILAERVWLGWSGAVARDLLAAIVGTSRGEVIHPGLFGAPGVEPCDAAKLSCGPGSPGTPADDDAPAPPSAEQPGTRIDVPIVGEVDLGERSLLASTVIIGFVDGINPCSMWVITVLLTIVVRTAERRRVIAVGTTFLVVTAAMYALYMAGIYSALALASHLATIQYVAAAVAGVFGLVSVKDYFAFTRGISFSISDSAKPGLYQRMRRAATSRSLVPALGATVVLGVIVSLLETPCTAGFPVLWTGLLHAHGVTPLEAAGLFGAYMVPFLLDELVIFGVVVVTMQATRMHAKHGQLLKLYAGVMMLALCGVMITDPQIMADPVLAAVVFLAAFALATGVHLVVTRVRKRRGLPVQERTR